MTTYTKGPWKHNGLIDSDPEWRLAKAVWKDKDTPICTTDFSVGKYKALSPEVQDANCRLIAAAPELLEALKAAKVALDGIGFGTVDDFLIIQQNLTSSASIALQIDNAIAKAEGKGTP